MNFNQLQTFGMHSLVGNKRVQLLAGVIRPDGNAASGGAITWEFLKPDTNHNYIFPHGNRNVSNVKVVANGSVLRITFPRAKRAICFQVVPDETLQINGIIAGASVGLETADISISQLQGMYGGHLTGSGSTFTKSGDLSSFTFGTLNANQIYFRPPKPFGNAGTDAQNTSYWSNCIANYAGSNDRRLKRIVSGLGSDYFGYQLLDNTGTPVVTNDANDIIEIMSGTPKRVSVNANSNNSFGFPGANLFTVTSNFWIWGLFEY
jgi:hypothetical protein